MAASGGSFLSLEAPNLGIVIFKEAEDGKSFLLRLRETAGASGVIFPGKSNAFITVRLKTERPALKVTRK